MAHVPGWAVINGVPTINRIPVEDSDEGVEAIFPKAAMKKAMKGAVSLHTMLCVWARALLGDKSLNIADVRVKAKTVYILYRHDMSKWIKYETTKETEDMINAFDRSGVAIWMGDYITLKLRPVSPSNRRDYRKGKSGTKCKRRSPRPQTQRSFR